MRILLLILVLSFGLLGGEMPVAAPESVGLSAERLARATAAMEQDAAAGRIAGAVGLVARKGKIAYFEARGMADREAGAPMRQDAIVRIYSMSKPITSAALMMLFEEGKFRLKDPVSRYMPELKNLEVLVDRPGFPGNADRARREPARREMTVQDVMRHTAGLTYGYFGGTSVDSLYNKKHPLYWDGDLKDMARRIAALPLLYHPGEKFHYSIAVDLQGRLIEVLSGQRFDRFLQERLFDPLGMADTGFHVPSKSLDRFAQLYAPDGKERIKISDREDRYKKPGTFFSGGGGLVSTARDYLRFCQMMLNGGEFQGKRYLGRKTVELMTADHLAAVESERIASGGYGFGLGFAVHLDRGASGAPASLGEYNWGGAAGTKFWIDPAEEMIGIYMVQIIPHSGLRYGNLFKQYAYQAIVD